MQSKQIHDFLFQLYDFADYLADQIELGNQDSQMYFLTITFIEKLFDAYGRGLINECSYDMGSDGNSDKTYSLKHAHQRIDLLRARINEVKVGRNFDPILEKYAKELLTCWPHTPSINTNQVK